MLFNQELVLAGQKSIEGKMYKVVLGKHVPYDSAAEVLSTITASRRHVGQVFRVTNGSTIDDWHFVGGIDDVNLVIKTSGGGAPVWGGISGLLADQTDLEAALAAKVDQARKIKINGVEQDLSADREWVIAPNATGRIGCQESWSGSGLTFDVTPGSFPLQNNTYNFAGGNITLDPADATNPRFDVIALDISSGVNLVKITGTPAVNPDIPQIDPDTQFYLTAIYVDAGATTPTQVDQSLIFDEGAEWTTAASGLTADFADTTTPFHGTKDINVSAGSNNGYLKFTAGSAQDITAFTLLKLYIYLQSSLNNHSNLSVEFWNGTTKISNTLPLGASQNFAKNNAGAWQNITINFSDFTFSQSSFDSIRIVFTGSSFSAFYLDYIQLQGVPGSTTTVQVYDATATVKGILKLSGDFGGTADAPTVPALANKADTTYVDAADAALQDAIDLKLDASAYNDRYKGKYTSLANLEAAHPAGTAGDYAQVDAGAGSDVVNYNYDVEDGWIEGGSGSAATTTDELPEGSTNKYFTAARVLATVLTGLSVATGGDIVATDTVLAAFGRIQKRFNDLLTNFNGANQLVKLDGSAKLPPVDGSNLTNLPGGGTTTPQYTLEPYSDPSNLAFELASSTSLRFKANYSFLLLSNINEYQLTTDTTDYIIGLMYGQILVFDTTKTFTLNGIYKKYTVGGANNCLALRTTSTIATTDIPLCANYGNQLMCFPIGDYLSYANKLNVGSANYMLEPYYGTTLAIELASTSSIRFKASMSCYLISNLSVYQLETTTEYIASLTLGQVLVLDLTKSFTLSGTYKKYSVGGANNCLVIRTTSTIATTDIPLCGYYGNQLIGFPIGDYLNSNSIQKPDSTGQYTLEPYYGTTLAIELASTSSIRFKASMSCYLISNLSVYQLETTTEYIASLTLGQVLVLDLTKPFTLSGIYKKYSVGGANNCLVIRTTSTIATTDIPLCGYYGNQLIGFPIGDYFNSTQLGADPYRRNADAVISSALRFTKDDNNATNYMFVQLNDVHVSGSDNARIGSFTEAIKFAGEAVASLPIKFGITNGDLIDGLNSTKSANQTDIDSYISVYNTAPFLWLNTIGNHDDGSNQGQYAQTLLKSEQKQKYIDPIATKFPSAGLQLNTGACYYFFDDTTYKIRNIFLDPLDIPYVDNGGPLKYKGITQYAFSNTQLNWLAGTALNLSALTTPTQWSVNIFCHVPIRNTSPGAYMHPTDIVPKIVNAFKNGTAVNEVYTDTTYGGDFSYSVSKDFTTQNGGGANFIGYYSGHRHLDLLLTDSLYSDQNNIVINNAWCLRDTGQNSKVNRSLGTVTSNSFDLIIIDKTARKVRAIRFGAGSKDTDDPIFLYQRTFTY